jgi:peptidoglycan/xylan/chitin deacetylase (PgdA/CDA1 family)
VSGASRDRLALQSSAYYRLKHVWQRGRIAVSAARPAPAWTGLRVLGYHSVSTLSHELALPPDVFRSHMAALAASALEPVPLAGQPQDASAGRKVAVTFDDGYRDLLDIAPLLERLKIPATVFVCSGVLDGEASFSWYGEQPPLLSWDDLRGLLERGWITVGAHTRTHPVLPLLDEETARDEIVGSKTDLEQRLQAPVEAFCYPGGLLGEREVALVGAAGFRYAVTCEPGTNDAGTDPLRLRRTMIDRRDGLLDFKAKIAGRLDRPSRLRARVRGRLVRGGDASAARAPLEE